MSKNYEQFQQGMEVREKVSDLIESIQGIEEATERNDSIDYAIKVLQQLKSDEDGN